MSALSEYIETIPLADLPALIETLSDEVLLEIINDADLGSHRAVGIAIKTLDARRRAAAKFWVDVRNNQPGPDQQELSDGAGGYPSAKP